MGDYNEITNLTDKLKAHLDQYGDINGDGSLTAANVTLHNHTINND